MIRREHCRRLTIPTIVSGLISIGPLKKITRHGELIELVLASRNQDIQLRFCDDDLARDEGYMITDEASPVQEELPLCVGLNCSRGCGCGCIRDYGYVDLTKPMILPVNLTGPVCRTVHVMNYDLTPEDCQLFTLKLTRRMINELVIAFMQASIETAIQSC